MIAPRLTAAALAGVVAMLAGGCTLSATYERAHPEDELPRRAIGDGKFLIVHASNETPLCMGMYDIVVMNGRTHGMYSPMIRFRLETLPENARVRTATLCLRRTRASYDRGCEAFEIDLTNVNEGVRAEKLFRKSGTDRWVLLDGTRVKDEEEMWQGPFTLEAVGLFWPETKWDNEGARELVRTWNPNRRVTLRLDAVWDRIDVTDYVRQESRGDRSLTLFLATIPAWRPLYGVFWYPSKGGTAGMRPRLEIEIE